jgi:hypothetical protein
VKVSSGHSWKVDSRIDNLKKLFSQIENRCAE